jgi:radical SAM superfamily enzyme YgiQ (UPF0313 family)
MLIKSIAERTMAADAPPLTRTPQDVDRLRILLVKPDISGICVGFTSLARVPPLDLLMVAASAPGHDVRIIDMRLEEHDDFEKLIEEYDPHVLGLTAYTAEAVSTKELCLRARAIRPELTIVQGGYHAAMAPDDAMDESSVDLLVLGEAESTFAPLLEAIRAGAGFESVQGIAYLSGGELVFTETVPQIKDLDTLPFADWSLVEHYPKQYYLNVMGIVGTVETTRGCPYDCSFCSVWVFNERRYRKKSPERVLEELNRLPDGIDVAAFVDDEFWVDEKRAIEMADLIISQPEDWRGKDWRYWAQVRTSDITRRPALVEKWADAGLKVLLLGIESIKDIELDRLHNKRNKVTHAVQALAIMREHGVEAWGCFIVNPEWEKKDFLELEDFVRHHEIAFPQFTVLTPLPGTPLTDGMIAAGILDIAKLESQLLDFLHATTRTRLPLMDFYERMASLYETTGMRGSLSVYKRAIRNGVMSREWLQTEMGRRVRRFFAELCEVDGYLRAHELLGHEVSV